MENPASIPEMLDLIAFTDTFNIQNDSNFVSDFQARNNLGDVQSIFGVFAKSAGDLRFFLEADYHNNKIEIMEKQIAVQKRLLAQSYRQLKFTGEQMDAANKVFAADSVLFSKNVLPSLDFENAKTARLRAVQNIEAAKSEIESRKIGILQSEQTIFDLKQQRDEQFSQLKLQYVNAFDQLKAQLKSWELVPITENNQRTYVLEVGFPNELKTTYNKTLVFSQEMTGLAEIITEDLRLIDRFLNPIRAVIKS
jgi:hypothetical protein